MFALWKRFNFIHPPNSQAMTLAVLNDSAYDLLGCVNESTRALGLEPALAQDYEGRPIAVSWAKRQIRISMEIADVKRVVKK